VDGSASQIRTGRLHPVGESLKSGRPASRDVLSAVIRLGRSLVRFSSNPAWLAATAARLLALATDLLDSGKGSGEEPLVDGGQMLTRRLTKANLRSAMACLVLGTTVAAAQMIDTITVTPSTKTLEFGKKLQLKAQSSASGKSAVFDWSVDGVVGGNTSAGTINAKGLYTAPADTWHNRGITIAARNRATGASGSAQVVLVFLTPQVSSISPSKVEVGIAPLDIRGNWFTPDAVVNVAGKPVYTKWVSRTALLAYPVFQLSHGVRNQVVVQSPGTGKKSQPKFVTLKKPIMSGVKLSPSTLSIKAGQSVQFVAESSMMLSGKMYKWAVNGYPGGSEVLGEIDMYGMYTAPDLPTNPPTVTISATTMSTPAHAAASTVTITPAPPYVSAMFPLAVRPGAFTVRLRGKSFASNAIVNYNGQPASVTWENSRSLIVRGTAVFSASNRRATLQVVTPGQSDGTSNLKYLTILTDPANTNYKMTYPDAGRLLEQATFGPTTASLDRARELGANDWVTEQLNTIESAYPDPPADMMMRRDWTERVFAAHMLHSPDQLRHRMAFALGQLFVVSSNKVRDQVALTNWQRTLTHNAFGNFRQLLEEVTLNPAMAHYLDMANSEKASSDGLRSPNENYAREIMQLFSIGLVELNNDGSVKRDGAGKEIPTYTQETIKELSRVFTGWGFPQQPGTAFRWPTPAYYVGQLQPYEPVHDTGSKTLLRGFVIPAGGGVRSDTEAALDNIFNHPNVGPFLATRLLRHFVKSNPSPAYINRVASAFNDNGRGVRGDMGAVLRAILTDVEARDTALNANGGKLKEPILYFTSVARAVEAQLQSNAPFNAAITREVGQPLLESPTVFNFFMPGHRLDDVGLYGPEFQIFTPISTTARANWVFHLLNERFWRDMTISTEPYFYAANDPAYLLSLIDTNFFYKRMSPALRDEILDTVSRQSDDRGRRAMSALWLAVSSGEYLIQH
jgi:uncharacterized protein (DUF1800 family)